MAARQGRQEIRSRVMVGGSLQPSLNSPFEQRQSEICLKSPVATSSDAVFSLPLITR